MEFLSLFNFIIGVLFFVCYTYQFAYIFVPLFKKDKPHKPTKPHRYAVLISARNEEKVLPQLLKSLQEQTYDMSLVTIFVVADNCTDSTAKVAAEFSGVKVYERFNDELVGKGYALDFLLDHIKHDYPAGSFDAFFVFDADNILDKNYIEQMNKTFSDGYKIITSYRNSKNYGDNWISAGYSLWFLRESKYLNYSRMLLGNSCAVSGTGFMFSREIIKKTNGWKFFLLTEDIQFTVHNVLSGEKIGFCKGAVLYDEQPVKFSQSWKQRLRWAKGYLQVFKNYGFRLFKGIFKNFSCFDMSMSIMPAIVITAMCIITNTAGSIILVSMGVSVFASLKPLAITLLSAYCTMFLVGSVTTITEWKNIRTSVFKKIKAMFTFPFFMLTYIPISLTAFFKKVKWTPIEHNINEIKED